MESDISINRGDTPRQTRARTRSRRSRRVKTFSGCVTCRARHLKCDEGRPGCQRCADAQRECLGYPGYRTAVQWKPVRGPSDFGIDHAATVASANWTTSRSRRKSAESSQGHSVASSPCCHSHYPRHTSPVEAASSQPELVNTTASATLSVPIGEESLAYVDHSLPPLFPSWPATPSGLETVHPPHEEDHSENNRPCTFPGRIPSPSCFGISAESHVSKRHIDSLSSMDLARKCIEHWINHLSDALSSVPGSMNPLKRIFVPIAYAGAMSSESSSTGSVALFYLICSASAFHLSAHLENEKQKSDYMMLAMSHQNKGIRHLQHNLIKNDPGQRESVLASILMCLTYEPVTVERNFWLTHLRGASQWLHRFEITSYAQSESIIIMYQMLAGTATMLRSQLLTDEVAQDNNFHFEMNVMLEPYHLHHIFGLPKRSLQMISEMIRMAVRIPQHNAEITFDLDRLEMELYLSVPQSCEVPAATRGLEDLIHHYSQIFYFSSIIYCKRRLRCLPLSDVQILVEQACDHIEALAKYQSRPYSPILWPVAVAFFEAQDIALRRRALVWLDFIIEQSTLSIWQKAKPMICSLWEARKVPGQEDMQWDTFLSDPTTPSIMMV